MTLIHGCGVVRLAGKPHDVVAAVARRSRRKPFHRSARRRRRVGSAGAHGRRCRPHLAAAFRRLHGGRAPAAPPLSARSIWSKMRAVAGVQHDAGHAPAASCRRLVHQVAAHGEDMLARTEFACRAGGCSRSSVLDRLLQVLDIGRRLLVDDDEIGDQAAGAHILLACAASPAPTISRSATSPIAAPQDRVVARDAIGHSADCAAEAAAMASADWRMERIGVDQVATPASGRWPHRPGRGRHGGSAPACASTTSIAWRGKLSGWSGAADQPLDLVAARRRPPSRRSSGDLLAGRHPHACGGAPSPGRARSRSWPASLAPGSNAAAIGDRCGRGR